MDMFTLPLFAAGAGYKSAMQLLQEAQPQAERGRAGHKSALELLREVSCWRVWSYTSDHLPQSEPLPNSDRLGCPPLPGFQSPPGLLHF